MADAYTTTTVLSNQVATSYQRVALFQLRARPAFVQFAKYKPGNLTNPGSPVTFTFWNEMALATTPLSETVDPDAVALGDSQISVTPAEYGNAVLKTIRIQTDTFLVGFDPDVAMLVSRNMVDTIDDLAKTALDGGTGVGYQGQATEGAITATDVLTAASVRQVVATLRANDAEGVEGDNYVAIAHPHVLVDLMGETGDAAWVGPHAYGGDASAIYNGEVGKFAGARFISSSKANLNPDGGSTTTDTYTTYFIGAESLAQAVSIPPHIVIGPVTDKLMRFRPIGWHAYLGFDTLREPALERWISASSMGAN